MVRLVPQSLRLQVSLQLAILGSCHKYGGSARSSVHIDQCVSAIGKMGVPVFLRAGYFQSALRSNGKSVDTWPLIRGGYHHVSEMGRPYGV